MPCTSPPDAVQLFYQPSLAEFTTLKVDEGEDRGEQALEAVALAGDVAGSGGDVAEEDLELDDGSELGDDGESELDNGAGDAEDDLQAGVELDADDSEDLGLERNETLEADLNLSDESLNAGNKVEDDLEVGSDDDLGVNDEVVELGHASLEGLKVDLEVNEHLEEGLGVDVGGSDDLGNQLELGLDLGLDLNNDLDNGLDDNDHGGGSTGADLVTVTTDLVVVTNDRDGHASGGGETGRGARDRGRDGRNLDTGLVAVAVLARAGSGDGVEDRGGQGGASHEGGKGSAEELHFDGW